VDPKQLGAALLQDPTGDLGLPCLSLLTLGSKLRIKVFPTVHKLVPLLQIASTFARIPSKFCQSCILDSFEVGFQLSLVHFLSAASHGRMFADQEPGSIA
jgi:hypothetical protein